MEQINAFAAHEITGGSDDVIVADIDTGLDFTHPDLKPNYDAANSDWIVEWGADAVVEGNDHIGHGTHTAGTIAAAVNGIGITGVAPNVRLAGIKSSNDDGFFFPEMVVCAYMWVATHGIDVIEQQLLRRSMAVQLRQRSRAAGDLASRATRDPVRPIAGAPWLSSPRATARTTSLTSIFDQTSPDNTTPVKREITNAQRDTGGGPGVIGVTATEICT